MIFADLSLKNRNGSQIWTSLRQGKIIRSHCDEFVLKHYEFLGRFHRLQARSAQPAREHRSAQDGGLRQQGRSQLVHRQEMRLRLQGRAKSKILSELHRY